MGEARRDTDISSRSKKFTVRMELRELPVTQEQMAACFGFVMSVGEEQETLFEIRIQGEINLPRAILIAGSGEKYYMELVYSMEDFDWEHPLHLANDNLTEEEVEAVLIAILDAQTDDIDIITHGFRDITYLVYPEEGK